MNRYKELMQERADLVAEGRAIFAKAEAETRDLTAEEKTRDDQVNARLVEVGQDLEREWRRQERERTVEALPASGARISAVRDLAVERPWGQGLMDGFGNFLQAVAQAATPGGRVDVRLYAGPSGGSEGMPSEGGFLVRHEYSTMLLERAMAESVLAPMCTPLTVGEGFDGIDLPYIKESSRATGSRFGGVRVYRRAEADTVAATKPEFNLYDLRLEDMMGLAYATSRLLRDASAIASIYAAAFAAEFAFKLDDEVFRGTGAGQCMGFTNSEGPRVQQAKESGQAAATIVRENISKMWSRVLTRSKPRGVWFYNSECEPQLDSLVLVAGTGALEPRVVTYTEGGVLRIKGRPAYELEQAAALGDEGDLVFADLTQYGLLRKGGIEAAESMHVRFVYGENTFRWMYPVNGRPLLQSAITPYKGSSTKSAFVTLAVRA